MLTAGVSVDLLVALLDITGLSTYIDKYRVVEPLISLMLQERTTPKIWARI
jgi:hypothetical protein